MRGKNRNSIADCLKLPQFTTMNVIDGQADLVIYSSLIFYSLTINNILNIIVLLILAGVTIVTLTGDGGLLGKANTSALAHKKSEYFEEIKMEVSQEHIERIERIKEEAFITSLANRLSSEKKEWVSSTIKCDDEFERNEDDYDNNVLLVITNENYMIYLDVDNEKITANIRDGELAKVENYTITYNANAGEDIVTGNVESQEVQGLSKATLRENNYVREGYIFAGWSKNNRAMKTNEIFSAGDQLVVNNNITLYAIWKINVEVGTNIKYKNYDFVISTTDSEGNYIARLVTANSIGSQNIESPSTTIGELISSTYSLGDAVTATVFTTTEVVNMGKPTSSVGYAWMYMSGRIFAVKGNVTSYHWGKMNSYIYPKLIISPYAFIPVEGETYVKILGDET